LVLEILTLLADLLIAGAIYYEIEETRASTFLSEAYGEAYKQRPKIYDRFVATPGNTITERAAAFRDVIYKDPQLREACELQLIHFSRFHYMLRRSVFHKNLMVKWFPHVLVKLWIMLSPYVESHEAVPIGYQSLMTAVLRSLKYMDKKGISLTDFYSSKNEARVKVSPNELTELNNAVKRKLKNLRS